MAKPSSPLLPTESAVDMAMDIDGASVLSKSTMYSYAATARPHNNGERHRGYAMSRSNDSNNCKSRHSSDSFYQQHAHQYGYNGGNNSGMASVGSGGSYRSGNSRNRRRKSRSKSHDYFHEGGNDDYYRDPERHPTHAEHGEKYEGGGNRSRYDDDRSAGSPPRRSHGDDASYGSYRSNGSRRRRDNDREYRRSNGKSREPHGSPPSSPVKEEWPPCFDTDGSAFVFDNRSAMFYEAISDFFYDPKSKLYYGNRKGAYFRYDATPDPPAFVEVQKVTHSSTSDQNGMQNTLDQVPIQSSTMPQQGAEAVKPKIAIKWKTKKIKSSSSAPSSPTNVTETGPSISKSQKQQIANIEKWTEKQAELKQDIGASSLVTMLPPTTTVSSGGANQPSMALSNPSVDTGKVRMTAKGEPICMVCKRKFPNIDKLRLHERASELHKNNLQKFQEQEQASGAKRKSPDNTSAPPAAEYQDRAQKRRQLHGPEMTNDRRATNMLLHNPPESAAPGVALDESHIGHQMLQKMGWKGHNANDDDQNGEEGRNNQTTTEQLRKDWDRIEALAKNNRR